MNRIPHLVLATILVVVVGAAAAPEAGAALDADRALTAASAPAAPHDGAPYAQTPAARPPAAKAGRALCTEAALPPIPPPDGAVMITGCLDQASNAPVRLAPTARREACTTTLHRSPDPA